jgi:hypothetical protein
LKDHYKTLKAQFSLNKAFSEKEVKNITDMTIPKLESKLALLEAKKILCGETDNLFQHDNVAIKVDIDISSFSLSKTPIILTTLVGWGYHYRTSGVTSIYHPTNKGFSIYLNHYTPPITVAKAKEFG